MRHTILHMLDRARQYLKASDRAQGESKRFFVRRARYWIEQARVLRARILSGSASYVRDETCGGFIPCIRTHRGAEVVFDAIYPHRQSASRVAQKALVKLKEVRNET